jgi:hypothetical protein
MTGEVEGENGEGTKGEDIMDLYKVAKRRRGVLGNSIEVAKR